MTGQCACPRPRTARGLRPRAASWRTAPFYPVSVYGVDAVPQTSLHAADARSFSCDSWLLHLITLSSDSRYQSDTLISAAARVQSLVQIARHPRVATLYARWAIEGRLDHRASQIPRCRSHRAPRHPAPDRRANTLVAASWLHPNADDFSRADASWYPQFACSGCQGCRAIFGRDRFLTFGSGAFAGSSPWSPPSSGSVRST
jgi:hypothetical protein